MSFVATLGAGGAIALAGAWVHAQSTTPEADPVNTFVYRGYLEGGEQTQVDLKLQLYDCASCSDPIDAAYEVDESVALQGGHFSVNVPLPAGARAQAQLWLEVGIGDDVTLSPRQQILAVPIASNGSPPGTVVAFVGPRANVPSGWALCDGRAASSAEYPALFAAIETTWGTGASCPGGGSGDFCFPDLRGVFLRGSHGPHRDSGGDRAAGSFQDEGTANPGLAVNSGGGHAHCSAINVPGNVPSLAPWGVCANQRIVQGASDATVPTALTDTAGEHTHGLSGWDDETRPKNMAVNYIIKL